MTTSVWNNPGALIILVKITELCLADSKYMILIKKYTKFLLYRVISEIVTRIRNKRIIEFSKTQIIRINLDLTLDHSNSCMLQSFVIFRATFF